MLTLNYALTASTRGNQKGGVKVTYREQASMFFESLLETLENIANTEIRERALKGLLRQTEYQLDVIKQLIRQTEEIIHGNNN